MRDTDIAEQIDMLINFAKNESILTKEWEYVIKKYLRYLRYKNHPHFDSGIQINKKTGHVHGCRCGHCHHQLTFNFFPH